MPTNLVDSAVFTDPIVAPAGADARTAASVVVGLQGLANRARRLAQLLTIFAVKNIRAATINGAVTVCRSIAFHPGFEDWPDYPAIYDGDIYQTGILVAAGGTEARFSHDGGDTWETGADFTGANMRTISWAEYFYAGGDAGKVFFSDNGGVTWTDDSANTGTSEPLYGSCRLDAESTHVVFVGDNGAIIVGNATNWTAGTGTGTVDFRAVARNPDSDRLVAVGLVGKIYTSDDDGGTWTIRTTPSTAAMYAIAWDALNERWIAAGGTPDSATGVVWTSIDDGVTWVAQPGIASAITSLAANSDGVVVAGTDGAEATVSSGVSTIYYTTDGGVSWSLADLGLRSVTIQGLTFARGKLLVAAESKIFRSLMAPGL